MCYGCYEEHGKPAIVTENTRNAAALVSRIYEFSLAGGHCHIIVDDFNIDDDDVEYCSKNLEPRAKSDGTSRDQIDVEREFLDLFKTLTVDERASALAIHEGWISA